MLKRVNHIYHKLYLLLFEETLKEINKDTREFEDLINLIYVDGLVLCKFDAYKTHAGYYSSGIEKISIESSSMDPWDCLISYEKSRSGIYAYTSNEIKDLSSENHSHRVYTENSRYVIY